MTGHADAAPDAEPPDAAEQTAATQPPGDVNDMYNAQNASAGQWTGVSQWQDSSRSHWDDHDRQSWGGDWHGWREVDNTPAWERRQSWDATTAATVGYTDATADGKTIEEVPGQMVEPAVFRGAIREIEDQGHGMEATCTTTAALRGDNGGFQGDWTDRRSFPGNGRASEKLAVPTFTGDDSDDIGNWARSYLRQIEAWRRMTMLPGSQQGLVLYQNLGGKAWIAAEELSVPRLASEGGVGYFVSWINARFLDLEVARIGKAFSDFFRRLKRKPGQTIREYNSEYDRLHARLREVGCSIPQECAAWLYIDRLQLDEPQELNLLASVGNEYNLNRLQQAAVLHDRGHRKPWESGRTRKPYTAHLTESPDGASEDGDGGDHEDLDLEDGVPEDVAVAYATYQSAKDRYKEHVKARGYQGDRSSAPTQEAPKKNDKAKEDKIKIMKARSFCGSCGKKGHWHRDPECPNFGTSAQGASRAAVKEVGVCHHVPEKVFSLRHDGPALLGITDTACAKAVTGTMWLQQYSDVLKDIGAVPELVRESESFRFGTGKVHHSSFHVVLRFSLGNKIVEMRTSVINGDVPLLMSKSALAQLGMVYDVAENRADFTRVGLTGVELVTTSSGHPAIPIVPAKACSGPERLVIGETVSSGSSQYTAFALSVLRHVQCESGSSRTTGPEDTTTKTTTPPTPTTVTTKAPPFKILYDKKLSPVVKELLTQDQLHGVSFMNWWEKTKINPDFWLERDSMWHRIHVVPRRALCNPSTWKTQHTVQKNILLQSVGDLRVTEGFCCRSGKPLEVAVDQWTHGGGDSSFPLLWVGRSSFAKVKPPLSPQADPEMACKQPAISKMTKTQLLEECNRLGLLVHRSWTCEELKATIMEYRMNDPETQQASAMKSVSGMTLAELRTKADGLGVMYNSTTTKGNLIRLIRDATSTPGSELMKIGKYRGYEFQEIPRQYGMWAAREIRMSSNPHVEFEETATVPYPLDNASQAASTGSTEWDVVTERRGRSSRDLPIAPRISKRDAPAIPEEVMDSELDPATMDEIQALETRLAVLKQKAKAAAIPPPATK
ncbi:GIP [Symbiodinium sp. CCMP2592]|nr:GIP [Symbiodinium sp. CCMP2592]